jgi:hypothetical protein
VIVRLLPAEGRELLYRVKSKAETKEAAGTVDAPPPDDGEGKPPAMASGSRAATLRAYCSAPDS